MNNKSLQLKKIKFSFFLLVLAVCGILLTYDHVGSLWNGSNSTIFSFLVLGFISLLCISLFSAAISTITLLMPRDPNRNRFIHFIKKLLIVVVLPVYLVIYIIRKRKFDRFLKKTLLIIGVLCVVAPIWVFAYGTIVSFVLGYYTEEMPLSGTGSMYPTFPKGDGIDQKVLAKQIVGAPGMMKYPNGIVLFGKRYFLYTIGRGDIVLFSNEASNRLTQTVYGEDSTLVKRVIALSGDSIELKGGIVYLNNEALKEAYTAEPQSTFGESFLKECKKIIVPDNSFFVMGDNRAGSGDSREFGFVQMNDIRYVLPFADQIGTLDAKWRDVSSDLSKNSKMVFDKSSYLKALNDRRGSLGIGKLTYQTKLQGSAYKRGQIMLRFNDYSFGATTSGYTMLKALQEVNYSNPIYWGEIWTSGFFHGQDLLESLFESQADKDFLLNNDYKEIGISEVESEVNGCPTHLIIQHLGQTN